MDSASGLQEVGKVSQGWTRTHSWSPDSDSVQNWLASWEVVVACRSGLKAPGLRFGARHLGPEGNSSWGPGHTKTPSLSSSFLPSNSCSMTPAGGSPPRPPSHIRTSWAPRPPGPPTSACWTISAAERV